MPYIRRRGLSRIEAVEPQVIETTAARKTRYREVVDEDATQVHDWRPIAIAVVAVIFFAALILMGTNKAQHQPKSEKGASATIIQFPAQPSSGGLS